MPRLTNFTILFTTSNNEVSRWERNKNYNRLSDPELSAFSITIQESSACKFWTLSRPARRVPNRTTLLGTKASPC
ncbi:unnamed protein product [Trifolium pratense]|uniref:Uncharacterized protein n=1 Tax=Trifolium pratense TaxID=57577 RepID=A0ACB0IXB6_TRIPR|nr:unnamed protein product [Trifolium pratense]